MPAQVHTTGFYAHPSTGAFAEKLVAKMPKRADGIPWKVAFCNSGSDANDMATMLARLHTGNFDLFTVRGASPAASGVAIGHRSLAETDRRSRALRRAHPGVSCRGTTA